MPVHLLVVTIINGILTVITLLSVVVILGHFRKEEEARQDFVNTLRSICLAMTRGFMSNLQRDAVGLRGVMDDIQKTPTTPLRAVPTHRVPRPPAPAKGTIWGNPR